MTSQPPLCITSARDFVRAHETDEYTHLRDSLWAELSPASALEQTWVAEIVTATWRLRRCALVESEMADIFSLDPMEDVAASRTQIAVDRARAQAFSILRRATAELRRLQTDRAIQHKVLNNETAVSGLASPRQLITAIDLAGRSQTRRSKLPPSPLASNCKPPSDVCDPPFDEGSMLQPDAA
jgi:hypothetical protein